MKATGASAQQQRLNDLSKQLQPNVHEQVDYNKIFWNLVKLFNERRQLQDSPFYVNLMYHLSDCFMFVQEESLRSSMKKRMLGGSDAFIPAHIAETTRMLATRTYPTMSLDFLAKLFTGYARFGYKCKDLIELQGERNLFFVLFPPRHWGTYNTSSAMTRFFWVICELKFSLSDMHKIYKILWDDEDLGISDKIKDCGWEVILSLAKSIKCVLNDSFTAKQKFSLGTEIHVALVERALELFQAKKDRHILELQQLVRFSGMNEELQQRFDETIIEFLSLRMKILPIREIANALTIIYDPNDSSQAKLHPLEKRIKQLNSELYQIIKDKRYVDARTCVDILMVMAKVRLKWSHLGKIHENGDFKKAMIASIDKRFSQLAFENKICEFGESLYELVEALNSLCKEELSADEEAISIMIGIFEHLDKIKDIDKVRQLCQTRIFRKSPRMLTNLSWLRIYWRILPREIQSILTEIIYPRFRALKNNDCAIPACITEAENNAASYLIQLARMKRSWKVIVSESECDAAALLGVGFKFMQVAPITSVCSHRHMYTQLSNFSSMLNSLAKLGLQWSDFSEQQRKFIEITVRDNCCHFKFIEINRILWALLAFSSSQTTAFNYLIKDLDARSQKGGEISSDTRSILKQVLCIHGDSCFDGAAQLKSILESRVTSSDRRSNLEKFVFNLVKEIYPEIQQGYYEKNLGRSVDISLELRGKKIAIEVDGLHHFLEDGTFSPATLIRNKLLAQAGYLLVSISDIRLRELSSVADIKCYMHQQIQIVINSHFQGKDAGERAGISALATQEKSKPKGAADSSSEAAPGAKPENLSRMEWGWQQDEPPKKQTAGEGEWTVVQHGRRR